VLDYNFTSKNRDAFMASLSVAGVDGTLEDRFRGTPDMKRRVIGKSGFVEGVSCLSGYMRGRDNQLYAFSIMMNGIPYKSNTLAKALQERIVRALDVHTTSAVTARSETSRADH
jgi:D-alanyl-D-alanine carboxypeptidase/D-alanyl-D-alanine-endopeptidase (penicillin-binding protein 4)